MNDDKWSWIIAGCVLIALAGLLGGVVIAITSH